MLNRIPGKVWRTPLIRGVAAALSLPRRAGVTMPDAPQLLLPTKRRLDTPIVSNYEDIIERASAPANPPSGVLRVYAKTDDTLHTLNSGGTDTALGAGGGTSTIVAPQGRL